MFNVNKHLQTSWNTMTPGLLDLLKLAVLSAPAPLPDWTQVALSAWFPWATPWTTPWTTSVESWNRPWSKWLDRLRNDSTDSTKTSLYEVAELASYDLCRLFYEHTLEAFFPCRVVSNDVGWWVQVNSGVNSGVLTLCLKMPEPRQASNRLVSWEGLTESYLK